MKVMFSPPDLGEKEVEEVSKTILSGWITTGPKVKQLENEIAAYCNTEKTVCMNSATACMEMVLRILGVGSGDEVIVPAYTYTATASVVCHVGAKPIFVDTGINSFELDYNAISDLITEKTKVIIPVDLGGVVCDYDKLFHIVNKKKALFSPNNKIQKSFNRVIILADSAHAFGAQRDGKKTGEIADFTSFSFHAVKNLTTAEGGAVTWKNNINIDNDKLYEKFQLLSLHGQNKDALSKTKLGSWEYDIITPAYKTNMTDIMAAIGLVQIKRYPNLLNKRFLIIKKYNKAFSDLNLQILEHSTNRQNSSGHLFLVRLLDRDSEFRNHVIAEMANRGIVCNVHYKPLPMMTAYKLLGYDINDFPNAYDMFKNEITLPLHTKMTDEMVDYVITNFIDIISK